MDINEVDYPSVKTKEEKLKLIMGYDNNEYMDVFHSLWANVDSFLFWASGKIFALRAIKTPCVILDTELMVWQNVKANLKGNIVATHDEELCNSVHHKIDIFK